MPAHGGDQARTALPAGTLLHHGAYAVRAQLGHGGFGIVYRALHRELRLAVAIKEYFPVELAVREGGTVHPRSGARGEDFADGLERFLGEARRLTEFKGLSSIVTCRDFFRENGTAYIVMGHEDAMSLGDLLAAREAAGQPFGEADLRAVVLPLLAGLRKVHDAGVLHRDIKPSNILIRRDADREGDRPVLIDFGAAKQTVAGLSRTYAPYTEGYAAIEQVGEGKLGPWTDLYALGAVMWRMVAGGAPESVSRLPAKVETRTNAYLRGEADPLRSAREVGSGRFSERTLEAIDRCLALRDADRVQDCADLARLLQVPKHAPVALRSEAKPSGAESDEAESSTAASGEKPPPRRVTRWTSASLAAMVVAVSIAAVVWVGDVKNGDVKNEVTNSIGMRFVLVRAGSFRMGSPLGEDGRFLNEPLHDVTITKDFYLGKYEVTQREWRAVMGNNPSRFAGCDDCPVENVSWNDATEFVTELNQLERINAYRLPTEAEWEYAARAGTDGARYHSAIGAVAWYARNSDARTHPVGGKTPNAWGLHDMLGNVWEWVQDWYGSYPSGAATDPRGPATGSGRVLRGGSWSNHPRYGRSAYRYGVSPGYRYSYLGFRVLRTVP